MHTNKTEATIGVTQGQLAQLMEMLQQVKVGQHTTSSSETHATANCAGIFLSHSNSLPQSTKTHFSIIDSSHLNI